MHRLKLTARSVSNFAKSAHERDELWDTEIGGFYIIRLKQSFSFRLKYRNSEGRQRTTTLGRYPAITVDQARDQAKKAVGRVTAGEDVQQVKIDTRESAQKQQCQILNNYLEDIYTPYQQRKKSGDSTLAMIRRHFKPWLNLPMNEISPKDVTAWQAKKEAQTLHFETIKRAFGALKTCLNHAVKTETISNHLLESCQLEKPHLTEAALAKSGNSRRYLSDSEVMSFFVGMEAYQEKKRLQRSNSRAHGKPHLPDLTLLEYVDHVKPWLLSMFYTGFRPGDLFGLRWEHINFELRLIIKTIEKTAHHQPEPRSFPLSEPAHKTLGKWHQQQGSPTTGYVFTSERTGGRMDKKAMQKPWKQVKGFGTLPADLDLYSLRHNFASQLIMSGADLLTVSKLMAHTDIQTTVKHYGHLRPDLASDYVNSFAIKHTPEAMS